MSLNFRIPEISPNFGEQAATMDGVATKGML